MAESKLTKFRDGLTSFVSDLVNRRTVTNQNTITADRLSDVEMRDIYRTGLGSKIIRLKAGFALKDTLQFESKADEAYYNARLQRKVKEAARWCLAFGRGIVVLQHVGDDLTRPLGQVDPARVQIKTFSGDMVTVGLVELNLQSPRYYRPILYTVRGRPIHWTRVVDFTYVKPPELDSPQYRYGGISEFELIHEQLVADGVVQRASPRILEKASTLFYKIKGFKEAMKTGNEADMVTYFGRLEDVRGIYAAGLIDQEDELEVISQTITGLADSDQITLRRLAMVTGISVTRLIGEAPRGMNSTGEKESEMDQDMIETLQADYYLDPINELMLKCGKGTVSFKENQGETPTIRVEFDGKAIDNARKLWEMGEDYKLYLEEKGVVQPDDFSLVFSDPWGAKPALSAPVEGDEANQDTEGAVDPTASLNGAQVTAILEVIARIRNGDLTKATAVEVMATAFPLSKTEANQLLMDVSEGTLIDDKG